MAVPRMPFGMSDMTPSPDYDKRGQAPAYVDIRRTKSSLPVRIVRRLTRKDTDYDNEDSPRLSKRKQQRAERAEQRKLEECNAYQRKQFADQISRQLEERQQNERHAAVHNPKKRSITIRFTQKVLRRSKSTPTAPTNVSPSTTTVRDAGPAPPPHDLHASLIEEFQQKYQSQHHWLYDPESLTTVPEPSTVHKSCAPAELDGTSSANGSRNRDSEGSVPTNDSIGLRTYPRSVRSPSPCLSAMPRRGRTISEIPSAPPSKQMQCDSCHDAIKMTGYHYACNDCPGGDCLYCEKCVDGGRTCRHELHERMRNINRHPSNPQHHERKVLARDRESDVSAESHIELSAAHPHVVLPPLRRPSTRSGAEKSTANILTQVETPPSPVDMMKEIEAKRREQDILFREKEVNLREREAVLREREALTATRERDAVLISQWQAATMFQQRNEIGAQFAPVSPEVHRHQSFIHEFSRSTSRSSKPDFTDFMQRSVSPVASTSRMPFASDHAGPSESIQRHKSRVASDLARVEAGMANVSLGGDERVSQSAQINGRANQRSWSMNHTHPNTDAQDLASSRQPLGKRASSSQGLAQPLRPALKMSNSATSTQPAVDLDTAAQIRSRANSSKKKNSAQESKSTLSSATSSQRSNRSKKAPGSKRSDRNEDEEENDEDGAIPPKRQKCDTSSGEPRKLFACPYFKHDPQRYAEGNMDELHYRGCAGGLFRDVPRVKQHLKRVHHRPSYYCRRCFEEFTSDDELQSHSSSDEGCAVRECPFPEKIDEQKQSRIHVKRPGKDPQELWFDIYSIIFPDSPLPDSPFIEQTQSTQAPPDAIDTFITLFNQRLDSHIVSRPWLADPYVRGWLHSQLLETAQHLHNSTSDGMNIDSRSPSASFANSPEDSRSKHGSNKYATSNRKSSNSSSGQGSPASLRPALTLETGDSSLARNSPSYSDDLSFPNIPVHVCDDSGYNNGASASWMTGDDVKHMVMPVEQLEPASATSTRSTKSVSFATPSSHDADDVTDWPRDHLNFAYTPSDFVNQDWPTNIFANNNIYASSQMPLQKPSQRPDSAYGTLSSAQNSKASLFNPTSDSAASSYEHLTCVDPARLFKHGTGDIMQADLQAYLNRDVTGRR